MLIKETGGGVSTWELSILLAQYFHKSKTVLKSEASDNLKKYKLVR
jgi:hypothetical protein